MKEYRIVCGEIITDVLGGNAENCLWGDKWPGVNLAKLTEILGRHKVPLEKVVEVLHTRYPRAEDVRIENGHLAVHACIDGRELLTAIYETMK